MDHDLAALADQLLDAARAAGADAADALARAGTSLSVDVRGGALEQAERSESVEIGLRVLIGQRSATVAGSDLRGASIAAMAERAVAMAQVAPEDPHIGLADPADLARDRDAAALELADPAPEPDPQALEADARAAEAAAMAQQGITRIDSASAGYSRQHLHLAASNGFSGGYSRTGRSLSCVAIAGEGSGMERDYDGDFRVFQSDLRTAEEIGRVAAERALARLAPRRPKTGAYPVLFDERVADSLIGHLLAAANGAAVARGGSWLRDALGREVLPRGLSLIEDPHRPRASASRPFDAEGLATRPRAIVEDGMLTGWTLDLANARKLGRAPTANAARGLTSGPAPANWTVELTQSARSRADLMAEMGTGLLVTSMIGATINANTGDYSRGAAGMWIENGAPVYPVSGVTIAGALPEMLRSLRPANDARPWTGRIVPSLLVEGLTLAGE
ncbi:TldD/PmbA family protein [Roseivivax sp. CAU 1761]